MGKSPDRYWWKSLFDCVYLVTDARTVLNDDLTRREVSLLEEALSLDKGESILDMCGGQGRHAMELSRRGYGPLTVLDFSPHLLRWGVEVCQSEGLPVGFLRADAREVGLGDASFDVVLVMGNSLCCFLHEEDYLPFLGEVRRVLREGGRFLFELPDKERLEKSFQPNSWHQADDDVFVMRERSYQEPNMAVREVVVSKEKGLIRDSSYTCRMFGEKELRELLGRVGFKRVRVLRSFSSDPDGEDLGLMADRIVVVGRR